MNIEQILATMKELARSQGYWGRLYEQLMSVRKYQPERWALMVARLEAERFDTELDMVLYFEEGKHCHAKIWKIPVVWESYGVVEIAGDTVEEALENFEAQQDNLGLPEADYVEGSFKLANDNREELIGTIKMLSNNKEDN